MTTCFLKRARRLLNQTWILASVSFVRCASSSLVYISGYWVLSKARSNSSSCIAVKVVLDRLCFRFNGIPGSLSQSDKSPSDCFIAWFSPAKTEIDNFNIKASYFPFHPMMMEQQEQHDDVSYEFENQPTKRSRRVMALFFAAHFMINYIFLIIVFCFIRIDWDLSGDQCRSYSPIDELNETYESLTKRNLSCRNMRTNPINQFLVGNY